MRHLVLSAPGDLSWQDAPDPELPGPEGALVRPVAVSTCDFDHLVAGGHTRLPLPLAIGHECVAEVVEVGSEVTTVAAGDVVLVAYQVACGRCDRCRAGRSASCRAVPWLSCFGLGAAAGGFGGAAADLLAVPYADAMLVALPEGVEPAHAAAAGCNIPDAHRCVVGPLRDDPGADVLVCGGAFGSIGLYAVALALHAGAGSVTYLDRDPDRARRAGALGASATTDPAGVPRGAFGVVADASQDPDLLAVALGAAAPAGTVTMSTMYPADRTPVALMDAFASCLTLRTGQPDLGPLLGTALDLLRDDAASLEAVVDTVVPWDRAPEAFAAGAGKHVCVR